MVRGGEGVLNSIFSIVRVVLVFLIALFIPRLFFNYINSKTSSQNNQVNQFKLGLENISADFLEKIGHSEKKTIKFGLISNQTGIDQYGRKNIDILLSKGFKIKYIFSPEHGISGKIPTENEIHDSMDKKTKIPILSLYSKGKIKPLGDSKILKNLNALIFDIQGCGMRHFTYITILCEAIDVAAQYNKIIVVLDRPNLLGSCIEGPLVETKLKSVVSCAPIPLRYGITVGELAKYYNNQIAKQKAKLYIVPMKNYIRDSHFANRMLTLLSPGLRTIESCYGYSFLGLLGEIKPFDVGLKTEKPFQYIALPETIEFPRYKWQELHKLLQTCGINSTFYRYFSEKRNTYCSGLLQQIENINNTASFSALLTVLRFFKQAGIDLEFSKLFDKSVGTTKVQKYLDNKISKTELVTHVNKGLDTFLRQVTQYLIYKPSPKINYLSESYL